MAAYSQKDKSPFNRLGVDYPGSTPPYDSRSSSPVPFQPADDHFAYSTSLRRHEPEPSISLDFGAGLPFAHVNSRFGGASSGPATGSPGTTAISMAPMPGLGERRNSGSLASPRGGAPRHHPFAHTVSPLTPSSHFATQTVEATLSALSTSGKDGLSSGTIPAIRELSGPNEFEVPAKPPLWRRFASQFYESPLILLLLASAGVSAVVGNYDDSASILAAIIIVVTGEFGAPYFLLA